MFLLVVAVKQLRAIQGAAIFCPAGDMVKATVMQMNGT